MSLAIGHDQLPEEKLCHRTVAACQYAEKLAVIHIKNLLFHLSCPIPLCRPVSVPVILNLDRTGSKLLCSRKVPGDPDLSLAGVDLLLTAL